MNIIQLYQDFGIPYAGEGDRHWRPGWVNVECPFCTGNPGYHLGYSLEDNYFFCWRCEWHPTVPTIARLTNQNESAARELVRRYGGQVVQTSEHVARIIAKKEFKLPPSGVLSNNHRRYLAHRGFDADQLEHDWGLRGTGPISRLDNIDFRYRIVIPIWWENRMVSFQTRDITDKHTLRYITCPKERELVFHKNILYGKQEKWGDSGICVEGVTDVWRFGYQSFATFGIKYTQAQITTMAEMFRKIVVCYDDDPQAVNQGQKLVAELRFRKVDAFQVVIKGDPASMSQSEADHLVKQLMK